MQRLDTGDVVFGVLEPTEETVLTDEGGRGQVRLVLSFRTVPKRIPYPILVPVHPDVPPHPNLRLPDAGEIGFLLPDPAALLAPVRDALAAMDDVPWCVPYSDGLGELRAEERALVQFVRIPRDLRTSAEEVVRMAAFVRDGGWVPVAWNLANESEANALLQLGLIHGEGPAAPRPAHEAFSYGEVENEPF